MSESGRSPSESPGGLEAVQNLKMEIQNVEMGKHCVFIVACVKYFFLPLLLVFHLCRYCINCYYVF